MVIISIGIGPHASRHGTPAAIIVASILFSRKGTFLIAGLSFILVGGLVELTFYGKIPRTAVSMPSARSLQIWIFGNL